MQTLTFEQIAEAEGLDDWRVVLGMLRTRFATGSMAAGAEFVTAVVAAADAANHHPDVLLRYASVEFDLVTHDAGGLTELDVQLARTISGLAAERGFAAQPERRQAVEVAIDVTDADAVRPLWQAATGAKVAADGSLVVPGGLAIWFQQLDEPRPQRNRIHLDVSVPVEVATQRVQAALAAGGTLLSDAAAPAFWVIADSEGNEVCICTAAGRTAAN